MEIFYLCIRVGVTWKSVCIHRHTVTHTYLLNYEVKVCTCYCMCISFLLLLLKNTTNLGSQSNTSLLNSEAPNSEMLLVRLTSKTIPSEGSREESVP